MMQRKFESWSEVNDVLTSISEIPFRGQNLSESVKTEWSEEQILKAIEDFRARHGRLPGQPES